MSKHSQFRLLGQRRFLPFYLTQFSGAFNDNLYKNALLLLITFQAGGLMGLSVNVVVNIAAFLFILPFFLFSGIAGQMADRYEKARIIRNVKAVEIGIMLAAALGLWFGWYEWLLVLLFLMGVQSTFFGPVKYSILPRVLADDELVGGNGLVSMGTFVAILLGTIAAGLIMTTEQAARITAIAVVVMAVLGYLAARQVPNTRDETPEVKVHFRPLLETWRLMAVAAERRQVLWAILAISWFWFLGAAYLTQFPNFAKTSLAGDETVVTLLLAMFIVGIAIGSMLCERLTKHRITLSPVPWGALGLTLLGIDLFFAVPADPDPSTWLSLIIRACVYPGAARSGGHRHLWWVVYRAFVRLYPAPNARSQAGPNHCRPECHQFTVYGVQRTGGYRGVGYFGLGIPAFFLMLSVANTLVWVSVLGLRRRADKSVDN